MKYLMIKKHDIKNVRTKMYSIIFAHGRSLHSYFCIFKDFNLRTLK